MEFDFPRLISLFILLGIAIWIFVKFQKAVREHQLTDQIGKNGLQTYAEVIDRHINSSMWVRSARAFVRYSFQYENSPIEIQQAVSLNHYNRLMVGSVVTVKVLPNHPYMARLDEDDIDNSARDILILEAFAGVFVLLMANVFFRDVAF